MAKKRDRWKELCESVEKDDGLPVRPAGVWTRDKLIFWQNYLDITTTAMVDNPRWPGGVIYIDLFAGPGVCKIKESGTRIPGSTLIAATTPKPFAHILACELKSANADALKQRLKAFASDRQWEVLQGDCNVRIDEIVAAIPQGALTLAFIDPTGLHAQFETVRKLTARRKVDLLVLFADSIDIHRNFEAYAKKEGSNLDQVLGTNSDWRGELQNVVNWNRENVCKSMAKLYCEQLRKRLGYMHFRERPMFDGAIPLYRLIYASKHSLGLKFWEEAIKKDPSGQGRLF